jgi:ribosomal protein L22
MKTRSWTSLMFLLWFAFLPSSSPAADFLGDAIQKGLNQLPGLDLTQDPAAVRGLDDPTIASGLKEALSIGTKNAVGLVSQLNGYFGNEAIKILLPDKVQQAAELLRTLGYRKQVDEFILSMNRAAEKAAPKAASHFADAIRGMSIEDARKILDGKDRAATDYFQSRTSAQLYDAFKPTVSESMSKVEVTRAYQAMIGKIPVLSLVKPESVDLDRYVTTKALEGLFHMVGEEEVKIRANPVARTTDLLKKVFAR